MKLCWIVVLVGISIILVFLYSLVAMSSRSERFIEQLMEEEGRKGTDEQDIEDFVDKVYNSIREFGYNLKTTPIVFVGGGAVVMKNFGSHDAKNISYNLDVKANARGYEQLATMGLKSTKRLS